MPHRPRILIALLLGCFAVTLLALLRPLLPSSVEVAPPGVPLPVEQQPVSASPIQLRFADSPFALDGPLREYWEQSDGLQRFGSPRSAPLWRDGLLTQLFDRSVLQLGVDGEVRSVSQPANWPGEVPPELLNLDAAPQRAMLELPAALKGGTVAPLALTSLLLRVPGYSGPAEVRIYDRHMRPAGAWQVNVVQGQAEVVVRPGGALGPQQGLVLVDGRIAGVSSAVYTLDARTEVQTGLQRFDSLFRLTRSFLARSAISYHLDGASVRGYRSPDSNLIWLRDHTYQGRTARLFDNDMTSSLDAFRRSQQADGSFPDFLARPQFNQPARRMPVEADVEYLFVQAVYEAWQASGDDSWLRENLVALRAALRYSMSDPLRWDATNRLVKRPFTIDTWDFEYGPSTTSPDDGRPAPRHWIDDKTRWAIFHGDNTGLARALRLMARIEQRVGDPVAAEEWREQSSSLMRRLNDLSWNGSFFTHQVPLLPFDVPGVDEARQLSLSNAVALNREVLEEGQSRAIIGEYFRRNQERGATFAEWYSIDPPFPAGSFGLGGRKGELPGEYVNGGLLPLVGGELARGAFSFKSEGYGFDILNRYSALINATNSSYLWYYPAGNPGISGVDTLATDGWGSSAMLAALLEGAAGISDNDARYEDVTLSPRWTAAPDASDVTITARYAASDGYVAYHWQRTESGISIQSAGSGSRIRLRLLLPRGIEIKTLLVNGVAKEWDTEGRGDSKYLLADIAPGGTVEVRW